MKKILFICAVVLTLAYTPPPAHAQQLIINEKDGNSVISGTITEVSFQSITLATEDDTRIKVDTEDLDLDRGYLDNYLSAGMNVQVIGKLDNGSLKAKQIIRTDGKSPGIITDID